MATRMVDVKDVSTTIHQNVSQSECSQELKGENSTRLICKAFELRPYKKLANHCENSSNGSMVRKYASVELSYGRTYTDTLQALPLSGIFL